MTRRGGREASESRSGIGEDEKQPVIARLAARWRRSNLVRLVALNTYHNNRENTYQSSWCPPTTLICFQTLAEFNR